MRVREALGALADVYVNSVRLGASRMLDPGDRPPRQGTAVVPDGGRSRMGKALNNQDRPFVAILGGAKVSDKLG
jgi:3-phosphoglycerate kinase